MIPYILTITCFASQGCFLCFTNVTTFIGSASVVVIPFEVQALDLFPGLAFQSMLWYYNLNFNVLLLLPHLGHFVFLQPNCLVCQLMCHLSLRHIFPILVSSMEIVSHLSLAPKQSHSMCFLQAFLSGPFSSFSLINEVDVMKENFWRLLSS